MAAIYAKTELGQNEIRERAHALQRHSRTLLVLVDGTLTLYVERGGKTVLTFGSDADALAAASRSLTSTVRTAADADEAS